MSFSFVRRQVEAQLAVKSASSVVSLLEQVYGGRKALDRALRSLRAPIDASALQGCLPLLMAELTGSQLAERIGVRQSMRVMACYRELSLLNLWYSAELRQVLKALTQAAIQVLVLKGADVASTVYPREGLRYFGDVDLLVHPDDLAQASAILENLGYSYIQEYRFEEISQQRAGFVYSKAVAAGYLLIELHISPHANELGVSFPVEEIWHRARPIVIYDTQVYGMGLEDLLLYLCWHYRSHFFERFIWLYDVALLLQRHGTDLDWALLWRLARRCGLKATTYQIIDWCQRLLAISQPEEAALEHLQPPGWVRLLIRRLFGENTTYLLRRSARRDRKILQHLLVDDFATLCLIAFRLVFPSPTHLGRLYMERSALPLHLFWFYYFVHPMHILREVLQVLLRMRKGTRPN